MDFGPFLFLLIYLVFALFFFLEWFCGLATWEIILIPVPSGSSFSKPCQDHVTSLLDQTLSALGCEATYISVHPKIPK